MAPTNCFNWAKGGLAPTIAAQFQTSGIRPKAVLQFISAEVYSAVRTNQTSPTPYPQLDFMAAETAAWRAIGMWAPEEVDANYLTHAANPTLHAYAYRELAAPTFPAIGSFLMPGGQHCAETWYKYFSFALPLVFRFQVRRGARKGPL
jgi:hypothetical protein